jgi:hypothetical protein
MRPPSVSVGVHRYMIRRVESESSTYTARDVQDISELPCCTSTSWKQDEERPKSGSRDSLRLLLNKCVFLVTILASERSYIYPICG